jgi:hypothetical protein
MKLVLERSKQPPILCQGDAFLAELEAAEAAKVSKASRKKNNNKKKKGVPDPLQVRT